jgi:NADH dehydrogenase
MTEASSKRATDYLEAMGVEIILGTLTAGYDGQTVKLNNGREIEANTLVWAAGVTGHLIEGLGDKSIAKGAYQVDAVSRVLRDPETGEVHDGVFAIGDVAHMRHPGYPGGVPKLAQAAIQQGRQLARNLNRFQGGKAMKPFHYRNKGVLATVGRNKAVADLPGGIELGGIVAWLVWMLVHLLFLIGFRNKIVVLSNWIWNYFTFDRGIRLILNPSIHKDKTEEEEMVEEI